MPSLVMRAPLGSLIERTNELVVRRQIDYADGLGVPWGISESAYNARDKELTYQYSNFGVPGLGFKRGLSENLVIAPYATALATMVDPGAAAANFKRLAGIGGRGRYGFYEALDFTPSRLPEGQTVAVVRAYMAHHQGMTVVAIANALLDGVMRTRFHAEPIVQATELLLQERTPRDVAVAHPRAEEVGASATVDDFEPAVVRRLHNPHAASPSTHLLSNGRYAVMLTAAGSGYSRWGEHAVTRWREDTTRDDWGSYVFLRDVGSGEVWSATYQPRGTRPAGYNVMFAEDRAEFVRYDGPFTTTVDVVVSPEDDAEVRRVSVANGGGEACDIEVTSYAEIVLAPPSYRRGAPDFLQDVRGDRIAALGRHPGDASPPRPGRARAVGSPSRGRRGRSGRRRRGRDRSRPFPRPRQRCRQRHRGDRRPAPVEHRRHGAGPGVRPAPAPAHPGGRHGADRLLDDGDVLARSPSRCDRQAPGHQRLRAGGDARLDSGAGAAPLSRHRFHRGDPLPAPGGPCALCQSGAAFLVGHDPSRSRRATRPVGAGHIGRQADRAGAHRRGRGCRRRPRAAARPRILAPEGSGRRSGDPERAWRLLRAGSAGRPGDSRPHQPVDDPSRDGARARAVSSCCAAT